MLIDALLTLNNLANGGALTSLAAGTPGYSDILDLNTSRDLAPTTMPFAIFFGTIPTSATTGATIDAVVQTSNDPNFGTGNVVELMETGAQPLSGFTSPAYFLFRGYLPTGGLRYYRIAYTASAVLTAGVVTAELGGDWPRDQKYPKNYVS